MQFLRKLNFGILKKIFFISSLIYFWTYFVYNLGEISFNINFEKNWFEIFLSLLFCIFSIYLNAYSWKNIVIWFGQKSTENNFISFYVITNILKYVPGGIWHFIERFNYIKSISNSQLAFYSTLIEPYFMLCASCILASLGIFASPIYLFLVIPLAFLNRKLIYIVLRFLDVLKGKASETFQLTNSKYELEETINLTSFFPFKAFLYEIGFVFSKFIGFLICFKTVNPDNNPDMIFLLVVFCLSWSIGLIVPTAPSGVGVFEACFLFFIGKSIPQNIILVSLIYFRLISTLGDLLLSVPFLFRKLLKKI